ncbi:hypothetical protein BC374_02650 [Ensifer sp. LC13]|nr:hypothetical protein BC362_20910 [Ensifer sp. LC14]OCP09718.1 hypothetical protein BC374_02650 [Ensifer sp. LC13]OCP10833.1 hypothetical protein BBX50_02995 [Ensifer sp. LC11]OCP32894.1 hypothetical protein BC364_02650 [Ensifer sp. LC499]
MTDEQKTSPDSAEIRLSPDEAVVLFELLSRWSEENVAPTPDAACFESTAECAVLLGLLAGLQKQLVAPFREDYAAIVKAARRRLVPSWDYADLRG